MSPKDIQTLINAFSNKSSVVLRQLEGLEVATAEESKKDIKSEKIMLLEKIKELKEIIENIEEILK